MHDRAEPRAAFAGALLDPGRPVPGGLVVPIPGKDSAARRKRRLAVYRNNVVVSLIDALASTFPAVEKLVGEDFFRAAAREFVRARPPRSAVLHDYGDEFPAFLASFPPAAGVPWLADIARLERAWLRAFHAADAEPATIDILRDVPADTLDAVRFRLHPSLALVTSAFPVVTIWAETTGRTPHAANFDLNRSETALIVRPRLDVEVRALPPAAATFVAALLAGATAGEATDAGRAHPDFDLATHLAGLFDIGSVVGLVTEFPPKA